MLGYFVEDDAGGNACVKRLVAGRHRDAHQDVARPLDQPRQPGILGADDEHQRVVRHLEVSRADHALGRQSDDDVAVGAVLLQLPGQVGGAGHRNASSRTGRGLPRTSGHPRRTPVGYEHSVRPERCGRTHDSAEVTRIGDAVEGDDERRLALVARESGQVVRVRVRVGRHLQAEALVHRAGREPVELGARTLQDRQPRVGGELDRLANPVVGVDPFRDIERRGWDHRPQRLDDGVAADHRLGAFLAGALARSRPGATRPTGTRARSRCRTSRRAGRRSGTAGPGTGGRPRPRRTGRRAGAVRTRSIAVRRRAGPTGGSVPRRARGRGLPRRARGRGLPRRTRGRRLAGRPRRGAVVARPGVGAFAVGACTGRARSLRRLGAVFGAGGRTLRPKPLALSSTGTDDGALLRARAALGTLALTVAGHQDSLSSSGTAASAATVQRGPCGVSSIRIPAPFNPSRTASAAAKSLRALASAR